MNIQATTAWVAFLTVAGTVVVAPKEKDTSAWDPAVGMVIDGTIVTMNGTRDVIRHGHVLIRGGQIEAIWQGPDAPPDLDLTGAVRVDAGPGAAIYPGLINLHDHPLFDALPVWVPPTSHVQAALGRPTGLEPYANRYQWNIVGSTSPPEYRRLVANAQGILNDPLALNLSAESVKYAEVKMLLGGTTATQGAPPSVAYDTLLARNVDNANFGRDRIDNRVNAIASLTGGALASVVNRMRTGQLDAWIVHLAEGVQDADRRPGDLTSSRAEFGALKAKGLLNDTAVLVHGIGLEAQDFAEMAAAPPARTDGVGDGRGAKLVWSPLSNLLLYGRTAQIYDALAEGVLVALGTDWSPSGSPNLLAELKVADRALRDERVLGSRRSLVPGLSIDVHGGHERRDGEAALDRLLVEMVTINAARAVRWDDRIGSVEVGKVADLIVVSDPKRDNEPHIPSSVYRDLINATEENVQLVLVAGAPVAGDVALMEALKPGDSAVVTSAAGCFEKAIDVTDGSAPKGTQSLAQIATAIADGLRAMGGDAPPPGGGPSPPTNTFSYLKARFLGTAGMTDAQFFAAVLVPFFGLVGGHINLEAMSMAPPFAIDDDWWLAAVGGRMDPVTGLLDDPTPPYAPYASNVNQDAGHGNPLAPESFQQRYFDRRQCGGGRK
jgi:cytosine/adenosine deaminase-related metal-dependent hydrolase